MPIIIPINLRAGVEGYRDANKDNWTDLSNYEKIQNDRLRNYEYGNTVDYRIQDAGNRSSMLANQALVDQAALQGNLDTTRANNIIAAGGLTGTQRAYDNGLIADNTTGGYRVIGSQQNANIANNNLSAFNAGRDLTVNRLNYDTDVATGQTNAGIRNNNAKVNLIQSGVNAEVANEYRPQLLAIGKDNVSTANLTAQQQQTAALQLLGITNAQYEAFRQSQGGYQNALNEQANANIAISRADSVAKNAVAAATSTPEYASQYGDTVAKNNLSNGANTASGDLFSWGIPQPSDTIIQSNTANSGTSAATNQAAINQQAVINKPVIDVNVLNNVVGDANNPALSAAYTTTGKIPQYSQGNPVVLTGYSVPEAVANNNLIVGGTYAVNGPVLDPDTGEVLRGLSYNIYIVANADGTTSYKVIR